MRRAAKVIPFPADPSKSAKVAGLRYVRDDSPGIVRIQAAKDFNYLDPAGKPLRDKSTLDRIQTLAIPPAWTEVWICPDPNGHLQAVGRDARGRKQYRYHSHYRRVRDETKFGRMLAFGTALPKIRQQVARDLNLPGHPKRKVLAAVVKLLDSTGMRVGNDEYAKQNESYGLTTLRDKHVAINGSKINFQFRGKSGQQQEIELDDPRLARIVKKCRDLPGYELFQYIDDDGQPCRIDSFDVNEYLREITGEEFSAKDFRTWNGTGAAALALEEIGAFDSDAGAKRNVVAAIKAVSARLGNRPATCRKYYVHPAVLNAYMDGTLLAALRESNGNRREEQCIMRLVEEYLKQLGPMKEPQSLTRELKASLRDAAKRRA